MVEYTDLVEPFVACCKKYKLKKQQAQKLHFWYDHLLVDTIKGSNLLDRIESRASYLEEARLLLLLQYGGNNVEVSTSTGGKVKLKDKRLLATLCANLQKDLQRNEVLYRNIVPHKKPVGVDYEFMGWYFGDNEGLKEPYTAEELRAIIQFETAQVEEYNKMAGRGYGKGEAIPMLGGYAQSGLLAVPDDMGQTDSFNLIADLMEKAGAIAKYKSQEWLNTTWLDKGRQERKNEVRGWINSYTNALSKLSDEDILGDINKFLATYFLDEADFEEYNNNPDYDWLKEEYDMLMW